MTLAPLFIVFLNGSFDWNLAIVVAQVKKSLIQALQNDANPDVQPNFEGSNNIVILKKKILKLKAIFYRN